MISRPCTILLLAILTGNAWGQTTPSTAPTPATIPMYDSTMQDLATYRQRAALLKGDDNDGRLVLARWAREHKLYDQAAELSNQILYREPGNRAAYSILQQVDDARPLPDEPDVEKTLKDELSRRFSHDFKTRTSKHFLTAYDTTDAFAIQRAASLEKTYDAFQFYFNMSTLRPAFLQHRLQVILVKDRDDYLAYCHQTEHSDLSWTGGFYSQRTNRSIFYDEASDPSAASLVKQQTTLKAQIDDLNKRLAQATSQGQSALVNSLTVERTRAADTLNRVNNQLTNKALVQNNATTMHEAAHQISFNMGIQTRQVDYPVWLSEGLACSFEVEDAAGRRGPALINFGRVEGLKQALKDNKLTPLAKFIAADPPASTAEDRDVLAQFYAESWGLFHYLYKFQREGTEKYLLAYKALAPLKAVSADDRKSLFTKAFGDDLEALNKQFVAYVKSLPARAN